MKPEIKKMWVEALRSGQYKQGRAWLHPSEDTFCCLGVLCDIYLKKVNWKKWIFNKKQGMGYLCDGAHELLPKSVIDWAGLKCSNPYFGEDNAIGLNDSFSSFDEIADRIESSL